MAKDRTSLIRHTVALMEELYHLEAPNLPEEWLTLDLTMPQVRILLLLYTEGPSHMSALASTSGIAMSTATGTVDQLVKRGLVVRDGNQKDRRLVICGLSARGEELASELWKLGRLHVEKLLERLTLDQLRIVEEAMEFLHDAASSREERQLAVSQ